jgi:hypothetical protein
MLGCERATAGPRTLFGHAIPAREGPKEVMQAISRAAKGALVIRSDRDEAEQIDPQLLSELQRHAGD